MKGGIGAIVFLLLPACWVVYGQAGKATTRSAPRGPARSSAAGAKRNARGSTAPVARPVRSGRRNSSRSRLQHSRKTPLASYSSAKPVLDAYRGRLPAALENTDAKKWKSWEQKQDTAIRARLEEGDLESMVNLLLLGTSFTSQPRIRMQDIAQASRSGALRARVDDLVQGMQDPGENERLAFLNALVQSQQAEDDPGKFLYQSLLHVMQQHQVIGAQADELRHEQAAPARNPAAILDHSSLFSQRGIALDTNIVPDFSIEQTLRDLKSRDLLRDGQIRRAAVVGAGLDFIYRSEESAYDYYPQQTLQPFALYDSLLRLGLAQEGELSMTVFDISPRVLDHLQLARKRAAARNGYVVQLPKDVSRPWQPNLTAYWKSMGSEIGLETAPIQPPEIFKGLETRAVRIRPDVVLACQPQDLDIVLQHDDRADAQPFDLIVGTNIFIYYDAFEQSLALENTGAMLKSGGLLLTNDRLPEIPGGTMHLAGVTVVSFDDRDPAQRDAVGWYRKQ